jgi:hypothetical protein
MAMTEGFKNYLLDTGIDVITHIGLFDGVSEITGGDPAYARKAVTWGDASGGIVRPTGDLTFDIPSGATVDGWRGFTADSGGTNYGGAALTAEDFAGQGQYKLLAASTGITLSDPA